MLCRDHAIHVPRKELDITTEGDLDQNIRGALPRLTTLTALVRLSVACDQITPAVVSAWAQLTNLRTLHISTCRDASGLWCIPKDPLHITLPPALTELCVSWYRLPLETLRTLMRHAPHARMSYHGRPLDALSLPGSLTAVPTFADLVVRELLDTEAVFLEGTPL